MSKETVKVLDAEDAVLGRLASMVAKSILSGEEYIIVNAEKAVITGDESMTIKRYRKIYSAKNKTNPQRFGPKRPKKADRFVKRTIRGMLPWKTKSGREAYKRVTVYIGTPKKEITKKHSINIEKSTPESIDKVKVKSKNFITIGKLCESLGGKND